MSEDRLFCNISDCNKPLDKIAWITRCSHVFCNEHGNHYFSNNLPKVKCPACNEIRNREVDVIKANLEPSDLLVCCVNPEKVIEYAIQAFKLWEYQMQFKRKLNYNEIIDKYQKLTEQNTFRLEAENLEMRKFVHDCENRMKALKMEIIKLKERLKRYKEEYKFLKNSDRNHERWNFQPFPEFNEGSQDFSNYNLFDDIV